jgi:hypothetical protein
MLAAEAGEEPEEKRERGAEDEAGDDGEVERGVFAAMDDVARKLAETKGELAAEIKKSAEDDKQSAEKQNTAAKFAQWIHARIIREDRGNARSAARCPNLS